MTWEKSVDTVVLTIVILLILYITYQTFLRRIVISTYYGRKRKSNKSKAWYLIISSMIKRRKLFCIRREYITIAIELDADETDHVHTATVYNCLLVDLDARSISLAMPLELHRLRNDHIFTTTRRVVSKIREIVWNRDKSPDLKSLNGSPTIIKLALMSDNHGKNKLGTTNETG